jgi:CheY-like chemotaxis protein
VGAFSPTSDPVLLVVDDNDDIRSVLTMLLAEEGYEVLEAGDGTEALDLALARAVDLIVLDYTMPGMDGAELCSAYRARGGRVPILLLTAANPEDAARAQEACGAVDCIGKPFELDHVLATIKRHAPVVP